MTMAIRTLFASRPRSVLASALLFMAAVAALGLSAPVAAEEARETRRAESLDPNVARDLLGAYEKLQNEAYAEALAELDRLMQRRGESMKPFDRASVLQIRGAAKVSLDRYAPAIQDFEAALRLDALPAAQNEQLRYNIAQLHFQTENYAQAVRHFNDWLAKAETPSDNAYYMLAAAHYYQKQYANARAPIERAMQLASQPNRRHFDLANIIYSELDQKAPRTRLLQRMIEHWPAEQSYWKQLAALQMEQGQERQAFTTMELAYRSGLLTEEADLLTLAQFYSVHNNPHRGAAMLEKEMADGRVKRDIKNLELLSQMLSQAREHAKAIPVLQEAARMSDTGMLSYRLGQVMLADERYADAERALTAAIEKGNLTEAARGDVYLLLGTARFSQAGPGDHEMRMAADQAFASAQRHAATRGRANEWRSYIKAINDTEQRQAALETQQSEMLAEAARDRELSACRTRQLAGSPLDSECRELLDKAQNGG
jgi:hypothetical protein